MSEDEGLAYSTLVNDMAKVIGIDPHVPTLYHFVYVDYLGIIALEQEKVTETMAELEQLFSGGGLALHEVSAGTERQEVCGNSRDCSRQAILLTSKRLHRLYKSISAV